MPPLSSADCEKLLALTGDLYTIEDAANLPQSLLASLRTIIPHEFGGCHLIEPSKHFIAACYAPERPPLPAQHKDFWRLAETHPLNRVLFAHPTRAWKLSDVISRQAFHLTEFYNALYRPLQVDCELVAVLPDEQAPGAFLLVSLHRRRDDFSERERALLNLLLPHVAGARRRLQERSGKAPAAGALLPENENTFARWLRERTPWELTQRECEVLFWLCQGKTNGEIGRILGIAERTAETHALHIYPKMGVENRYTAIATLNRFAAAEGH
jgi:DNA-binding CsgD family transcriptional regulator